MPGQYSHFSSFALAFQVLVGSCFQPLLPSTDFKTNWTKFPVIFWGFFGYSQNFDQTFGPFWTFAPSFAKRQPARVLPQVLLLYFRHGPGDGRAVEVALAQLLRLYEGKEVEMCKSHMNYSETQRKTSEDHGVDMCGYPFHEMFAKRMNSGVMDDVSDSGSF